MNAEVRQLPPIRNRNWLVLGWRSCHWIAGDCLDESMCDDEEDEPPPAEKPETAEDKRSCDN